MTTPHKRSLAAVLLLAFAAAQCDRSEAPGPAPAPPVPAEVAKALQAVGSPPPAPPPPPPAVRSAIPQGTERVRLMISGALQGRLEPCGCASGQLGGLARRAFLLNQQPDQHDLLLEGGGLIAGGNELDFLKLFKIVEILFAMQRPYHALGVDQTDLMLPLSDWCGVMSGLGVPVVSSDLRCRDEALPWPGRPFVELPVRGTRVRIASLTMALPEHLQRAEPAPLELLPPTAGWQAALAGADDATLRVLMIHAGPETIRALVPTLTPPPDLVIGVSDAHSEPKGEPDAIGAVPLVWTGIRGRMLVDATLARPADGPRVGYQIVPLAGSTTKRGAMEDLDVKAAILQHRHQVKDDGILQKLAEQTPTTPGGASYVGSQSCQSCHPKAYQIWADSKHGHAWQTLEQAERDPDRYGWPVTAYPDCVSCHVVGYGRQSGFVDPQRTPALKDVGCEECHGPGSNHLANPIKHKLGRVGGGIAARVCTTCHDFEQSPNFNYGTLWALIKHGKD